MVGVGEGLYGGAMSSTRGFRDFNSQPQGLRLSADTIPPSIEEEVRTAIWNQIVLGNADEASLAFDITDQFSEGTPVSEDDVRAAVRYLLAVRRRQQESFGEVVTNLDDAFAALRERGVAAEQAFSCCNNCGFHEIHEVAAGPQWAGFVFFHMQDAERLIETGETYLSYGMFWRHYRTREESDAMSRTEKDAYYKEQTLDLMRRVVVPVLREHGMEVDWDGDPDARVLVRGAEFYRAIS